MNHFRHLTDVTPVWKMSTVSTGSEKAIPLKSHNHTHTHKQRTQTLTHTHTHTHEHTHKGLVPWRSHQVKWHLPVFGTCQVGTQLLHCNIWNTQQQQNSSFLQSATICYTCSYQEILISWPGENQTRLKNNNTLISHYACVARRVRPFFPPKWKSFGRRTSSTHLTKQTKDVDITSCECSSSKIQTIKTYSLGDLKKSKFKKRKREREAAGFRRKSATTAKN